MAAHLELSRDGGAHWERLASDLTSTTFSWTVTGPATTTARVRVVDANRFNVSDQSDANFAIASGSVDAQLERPAVAAFSRGRPNPARGPIAFEIALPEESPVNVEAYDVNGRKVATLAHGRLPAGYHTVRWDGAAQGASAGVYFVRARWNGFEAVRHVVVMK
jgi:hypothetical protein